MFRCMYADPSDQNVCPFETWTSQKNKPGVFLASLAPTPVRPSESSIVILSYFHSVSVLEPLQSVDCWHGGRVMKPSMRETRRQYR